MGQGGVDVDLKEFDWRFHATSSCMPTPDRNCKLEVFAGPTPFNAFRKSCAMNISSFGHSLYLYDNVYFCTCENILVQFAILKHHLYMMDISRGKPGGVDLQFCIAHHKKLINNNLLFTQNCGRDYNILCSVYGQSMKWIPLISMKRADSIYGIREMFQNTVPSILPNVAGLAYALHTLPSSKYAMKNLKYQQRFRFCKEFSNSLITFFGCEVNHASKNFRPYY
ncbi:unnamed protein product, partial [Nesidiocoris tenuis]